MVSSWEEVRKERGRDRLYVLRRIVGAASSFGPFSGFLPRGIIEYHVSGGLWLWFYLKAIMVSSWEGCTTCEPQRN